MNTNLTKQFIREVIPNDIQVFPEHEVDIGELISELHRAMENGATDVYIMYEYDDFDDFSLSLETVKRRLETDNEFNQRVRRREESIKKQKENEIARLKQLAGKYNIKLVQEDNG